MFHGCLRPDGACLRPDEMRGHVYKNADFNTILSVKKKKANLKRPKDGTFRKSIGFWG